MELEIVPGTNYPLNLKAGESVSIVLPPSRTGWFDVGVYVNPKTVDGAEVEFVGGGYRKVGAASLTHFYMQGKSAVITAEDATGFVLVVKMPAASTAVKLASRQEKV